MKTAQVLLSVALSLEIGAAEVVNFNNDFELDAKGNPAKWEINKLKEYEPFGEVKPIKGGAGQNSIRMISKGKSLHYFCKMPFNAKAGDTVTIRAKISGRGSIAFGGYFYGEQGRFCYGYFPMFSVPEKPKIVSKSFKVEARQGRPEPKTGYIVLAISAGSDVIVSELDAEIGMPK